MAKEGQPTDAETAALLFGLGCAQGATIDRQRLGEAVANLRGAFDYYVDSGDVAQAVAVAEYPFYAPIGHRTGITELIAGALKLVQPDSHQAGRLLSRYGAYLYTELGDYQERRRLLIKR